LGQPSAICNIHCREFYLPAKDQRSLGFLCGNQITNIHAAGLGVTAGFDMSFNTGANTPG
jgi:hypothetical protein